MLTAYSLSEAGHNLNQLFLERLIKYKLSMSPIMCMIAIPIQVFLIFLKPFP